MDKKSKYIDRFWSYVDKKSPDDCWPWIKASGNKYGFFWDGEKTVTSHRFAYEVIHGEGSAASFDVCHTCDYPPCCNPNHLFKGTTLDNVRDMIIKGRARLAITSKLTEEEVYEVKKLLQSGITPKLLAKRFNVSYFTISDIKRNRTWKQLKKT